MNKKKYKLTTTESGVFRKGCKVNERSQAVMIARYVKRARDASYQRVLKLNTRMVRIVGATNVLVMSSNE